jgi:hypothetical protein
VKAPLSGPAPEPACRTSAQPDAIERHADEIVFLWHDEKVAVVVERDDDGTPCSVEAR